MATGAQDTNAPACALVRTYILDRLAVHGKEDIGHAHGAHRRRVAARIAQIHDFEHLVRAQDVNLEPDAVHAKAPDLALLRKRMHGRIVLPQQRATGPPLELRSGVQHRGR